MRSIKPMVNQWLAVREEREELAARLARKERERLEREQRQFWHAYWNYQPTPKTDL